MQTPLTHCDPLPFGQEVGQTWPAEPLETQAMLARRPAAESSRGVPVLDIGPVVRGGAADAETQQTERPLVEFLLRNRRRLVDEVGIGDLRRNPDHARDCGKGGEEEGELHNGEEMEEAEGREGGTSVARVGGGRLESSESGRPSDRGRAGVLDFEGWPRSCRWRAQME